MPDTIPLFELDGVTVPGRDRPRLDRVTGAVPNRGITVVAGPSGSGKSTLLRCCNRLEAPDEGTVRFRGEDLTTLDPRQHRRRVGMVFQSPVAFPGTVLDNLRVADADIPREEAERLLTRVQLDPALVDREAGTMSGGEAQRMVIARAMATSPEVLLWVTHDLRQMRRLADHLVVVLAGRWAWSGEPDAAGAPAAVADFLDQGPP